MSEQRDRSSKAFPANYIHLKEREKYVGNYTWSSCRYFDCDRYNTILYEEREELIQKEFARHNISVTFSD